MVRGLVPEPGWALITLAVERLLAPLSHPTGLGELSTLGGELAGAERAALLANNNPTMEPPNGPNETWMVQMKMDKSGWN